MLQGGGVRKDFLHMSQKKIMSWYSRMAPLSLILYLMDVRNLMGVHKIN
jgi:hypothetical protein